MDRGGYVLREWLLYINAAILASGLAAPLVGRFDARVSLLLAERSLQSLLLMLCWLLAGLMMVLPDAHPRYWMWRAMLVTAVICQLPGLNLDSSCHEVIALVRGEARMSDLGFGVWATYILPLIGAAATIWLMAWRNRETLQQARAQRARPRRK